MKKVTRTINIILISIICNDCVHTLFRQNHTEIPNSYEYIFHVYDKLNTISKSSKQTVISLSTGILGNSFRDFRHIFHALQNNSPSFYMLLMGTHTPARPNVSFLFVTSNKPCSTNHKKCTPDTCAPAYTTLDYYSGKGHTLL